MKSIRLFLYTLLSVIIFSSCGDGGNSNINSIKLIPVKSGSDFGYIDWEGKIVINPQFSYAGLFTNDDVALIKTSGNEPLFGYIDTKGSYVINPQFIYATDFTDGIALVVKANEAPKAINKKGETVFEVENAQNVREFSEGLAAFSVENEEGLLWGFIDNKGTIVITPQFSGVGFFSEGKCAISNKGGKWGFIDNKGQIVINNQFSSTKNFENGKAVVFDGNDKAGLIDKEGKYLINPQFQGMYPDGKMFLIQSGGKIGWADSEGTIIINPQFENAYAFNGGNLAAVEQGGSWGYVDKEGKFIINPQFDWAYPFIGGKAIVESGSFGIIDQKGRYLVNPQFDGLSSAYTAAIRKDKTAFVTSDYFDVEAIANGIKKEITPNTVSGFTFSTPLSEMMAKYPTPTLQYYYGDNHLFKSKEINKYSSLSLSVEGTIYIQSGWSYVPNPNSTVDSFLYTLNTQGKAVNKQEEILKSLENGFSGFTKVSNPTGGRFQYSNENMLITVGVIGGRIAVRVSPNQNTPVEAVAEPVHEDVN